MTDLEQSVKALLPDNVTEAQVRFVVALVAYETMLCDEQRRLANIVNDCSGLQRKGDAKQQRSTGNPLERSPIGARS